MAQAEADRPLIESHARYHLAQAYQALRALHEAVETRQFMLEWLGRTFQGDLMAEAKAARECGEVH